MKNQFQKKKRGSMFFETMIRDNGEDFMIRVRPNDLFKKAHLLFKDIAHGSIDINKYGKYFLDGNFLSTMIKASYEKRFYYMTHVNGLNLVKQYLPANAADPLFNPIERADMESLSAYQVLNDGFNSIMATGDLGILAVMMNQIKPFRYAV